ncbi:unnamed protein product, partial [Laminaria digitata]
MTHGYRPGGSPLSSPVCWSYRCMDIFMMRGWTLSFPGVAEPRIYEPQSATSQTGPALYAGGPGTNFVQGAGLIGRGWPFGRPEFFWKNATKTRGGATWLALPTL